MTHPENPSLRALLGAPVAVQLGDLQLQIAPMGWHQAASAVEHVLPFAASLPGLLAEPADAEDRLAQVVGIAVVWRDAIGAFLAEATRLPRDEVLALPPPLAAELLLAVLEINADFFARSLPGLVERATGRLAALQQRLAPAIERQQAGDAAASAPTSPGSTTSSSA